MRAFLIIFSTLIIIGFISCNSSPEVSNDENYVVSEVALASPSKNNSIPIIDTAKKIIKSATITIETEEPIKVRQQLANQLNSLKGYIEEEQNSSSIDYQNTILKCRIPTNNFEIFLNVFDKLTGKVTNKLVKRIDVTNEYIERETTLSSQKALEKRYIELLSKATKVPELIEIESKLAEIRTSIEISKTQFSSLKKQIKYSDLEITIVNTNPKEDESYGFLQQIKSAFVNGFSFLKNLVIGIITIWPLWIIIVIILFSYKKYRLAKKNPKV